MFWSGVGVRSRDSDLLLPSRLLTPEGMLPPIEPIWDLFIEKIGF